MALVLEPRPNCWEDTMAGRNKKLVMEWPRIPLPHWPNAKDGRAAEVLARSAARGRKLAALLDTETPVLKKWLSYRESAVLGRRLRADEIRHFTDTARRIGALLLASSDGPERRPQ